MDDKAKRGQPDRLRVNTHEDYEVRYWSKKFHCSPEKLKAAAHKAGPMARDIAKVLKAK